MPHPKDDSRTHRFQRDAHPSRSDVAPKEPIARSAQAGHAGRAGRPGIWIAVGLGTAAAVLALDGALEVGPGEAAPLRWVRVAAQHPERLALAAGLCAWGLFSGWTGKEEDPSD